ncbi:MULTISPECIES: hypothetical protein [Oceanobacillus]|nr:hypothetical protein [Oceanobacillus profundus]MBR3118507.1 hypothetical protein [Oceanobacillus sp.]
MKSFMQIAPESLGLFFPFSQSHITKELTVAVMQIGKFYTFLSAKQGKECGLYAMELPLEHCLKKFIL